MVSFYGTSRTGACQKAAFRPLGSTTLTWQSYRPGGSLFSVRLKPSGSAFDLGSKTFRHRQRRRLERFGLPVVEGHEGHQRLDNRCPALVGL